MLCEPLKSDEPIFFAIRGDYAYGLLRLGAGHHRVRDEKHNSVARLHIAPWTDHSAEVSITTLRALKKRGQLGGRIRSRVETEDVRVVLQNDRTLAENLELARDVVPSWSVVEQPKAEVVRRYDLKPFFIRDYLTDTNTGRFDSLKPPPHFTDSYAAASMSWRGLRAKAC